MPRQLYGEAFLFVSFAYLVTRDRQTPAEPISFTLLSSLLLFEMIDKKTVETGRKKCQKNNTSKNKRAIINFNHTIFSQYLRWINDGLKTIYINSNPFQVNQ